MNINRLYHNIIYKVSPTLAVVLSYKKHHGEFFSTRKIKKDYDLSQIWITKMVNGYFLKYYYLADKFAVRSFIEEKGLGNILIPLLGCYNNAKEIDFEKLPAKFVLKLNTDAGMNFVCKDKSKIDVDVVIDTLNGWLKSPRAMVEKHYNLIPRKIICESYIGNGDKLPVDYKFICIHGEPQCVLACGERDSGNNFAVYDKNWKWLSDWRKDPPEKQVLVAKPDNLDEMLHIARRLSSDIDLVRVDLYDVDGKIYFGEMTLTPSGAVFHGWTKKALNILGHCYHSDMKISMKQNKNLL